MNTERRQQSTASNPRERAIRGSLKRREEAQQELQRRYDKREFEAKYMPGMLWSVFPYTKKDGSTDSGKVVKMFNPRGLPEVYQREDQDSTEAINDLAHRFKREREYIAEQYTEQLPDLLLAERIFVSPGTEDRSSRILAIQEQLSPDTMVTMAELRKRLNEDPATAEEAKKFAAIQEQLRTFVDITKKLMQMDRIDPEFSRAVPDLSHLNNIMVDWSGDEPTLKLLDTDMVVPINGRDAIAFNFHNRIPLNLMYIEAALLDRSMNEIITDDFYVEQPAVQLFKQRGDLRQTMATAEGLERDTLMKEYQKINSQLSALTDSTYTTSRYDEYQASLEQAA